MSRLNDPDAIKEGIRLANEMRQEWLESIASGAISFDEAVQASKYADHKAIAALRLLAILSAVRGWNEPVALQAMDHYGFRSKDTIRSIRKSKKKVEQFSILLRSDKANWRVRPKMPMNWPWFGKMTLVLDEIEDEDHNDPFSSILDEEGAEVKEKVGGGVFDAIMEDDDRG